MTRRALSEVTALDRCGVWLYLRRVGHAPRMRQVRRWTGEALKTRGGVTP